MIGPFFDAMIVASTDEEWLQWPISKSKSAKCWKLFWVTLKTETKTQYISYKLINLLFDSQNKGIPSHIEILKNIKREIKTSKI